MLEDLSSVVAPERREILDRQLAALDEATAATMGDDRDTDFSLTRDPRGIGTPAQ
jgi:hypothetical protein